MADKIRKYFAKKKTEAKFKLAGPGHKLSESTQSFVGPSKKKEPLKPVSHREGTEATKQAAEAALARLNSHQRKDNAAFNTSLAAIQAQVRRELEAEKQTAKEAAAPHRPIETELEASPHLAVKGVYFKCPFISDEVLSKEEWRGRIKEVLMEQLEEERGITACLMIQSCNYNRIKVSDCTDVLCRYLDNIMANPEETKFHKIRCSNANFRDKVMPIFGSTDLLMAAGFTMQKIEHNGAEEDFYVFDIKNVDGIETLEFLRDALKTGDRIELELDRNMQVLSPVQASKRVELPRDFFAITTEELKREQQLKSEAMEKQLVLRTKAMREKEELREIRKYKFALIRIRFPDGLYLQGTFSVYEKFEEVLEFVQENLETPLSSFTLASPTGHKLEEADRESTLMDLRLVPATILTFQWHSEEAAFNCGYLKPEVMILVQSI